MYTLRQYLLTLSDTRGLTRTLGEIDVCRTPEGELCYSAGNSAIVFRIHHEGRLRTLRCYLRPMRHLREIYGCGLLEKELFLYTSSTTGIWVDVVLGDWIEGVPLHEAIARAALRHDRTQLSALAASFDRLAAALVSDQEAHGDLKPENIILTADGELHPIDFDARFLPVFAGEQSPELGTVAYQHPARTAADFNASTDDYPAALISTALHALRLDPTLYDRHSDADGLLFRPQTIRKDPALREALALFEHEGCAVQLRIARLLYAPTPRLFGLSELFTRAVAEQGNIEPPAEIPELFVDNGRWGYRTAEQIVVPALYDCGFDFTEGMAAVQLGTTWHFIDTSGRIRLSFPGCEAVKPFRGGRALIVRGGKRYETDRNGKVFDI